MRIHIQKYHPAGKTATANPELPCHGLAPDFSSIANLQRTLTKPTLLKGCSAQPLGDSGIPENSGDTVLEFSVFK